MRFFVLYDDAGAPQRVAQTDNNRDAGRFLSAGFVEVGQAVFDALVNTVTSATVRDLALLTTAASALAQLRAATRTEPPRVTGDAARTIAGLERRFQAQAADLTRQYFAGEITLDQWDAALARQINANILAGRAVGVGGIDNLSREDLAAIELETDSELRYLNRFRRQLANGELSEAQATARAQLYAGTATVSYERGRQDAVGMPLLPAQPKQRTLCHRNCKCSWRIVELEGNGNWDCYWELSPAEHCETCLARARSFNPLRIRNGIIQPFNPLGIYA